MVESEKKFHNQLRIISSADSSPYENLYSYVSNTLASKKVTKLDRDPFTGPASQEISFWLNLERSLNRILEKRQSVEVTLKL